MVISVYNYNKRVDRSAAVRSLCDFLRFLNKIWETEARIVLQAIKTEPNINMVSHETMNLYTNV